MGLVTQFLRYAVVGLVAFIADFVTMVAMVDGLGCHYLVGATFGFLVGLAVNYGLSIRWVFTTRSLSHRGAEFLIFSVIGVGGLVVTAALMWFGADVLGLDYRFCKVVTVAVVTVWNFGLRRFMLFGGARI